MPRLCKRLISSHGADKHQGSIQQRSYKCTLQVVKTFIEFKLVRTCQIKGPSSCYKSPTCIYGILWDSIFTLHAHSAIAKKNPHFITKFLYNSHSIVYGSAVLLMHISVVTYTRRENESLFSRCVTHSLTRSYLSLTTRGAHMHLIEKIAAYSWNFIAS